MACRLLLPQQGIKPSSPAVEAQSLNHWTIRKVPKWDFLFSLIIQYQMHSSSVQCFGFHLVLVAQSCPTLCNTMDCSLPGSSAHGILQARILEWVAIPFSRGSSWPRDWTRVSYITSRFSTTWATREAHYKQFRDILVFHSISFSLMTPLVHFYLKYLRRQNQNKTTQF